jgi:hypothetical protein
MSWKPLLLVAVAAFAVAPPAASQGLVATYHRCSTADEGEADFIMNTVFSDIYQKQVDNGSISGWGWVEHTAGGPWRRISTITAPDRAAAMTAWGAIVNEIEAEHPGAWHRFNEICGSHHDYVWNLTAASEGTDPATTPSAWASQYWVCDETKEARADELMMEEMGPVYDKHIAAGHLAGWSWYSHEIGGRFRRLLTVAAADDFDLLDGRAMVIDELFAEHADVLEEFGNICGGHVDYLWANARPAN